MNKDFVPAWLVVLVGLFAITAIVTFGSFLYYFADVEGVKEEILEADRILTNNRVEKAELEKLVPALADSIKLRVQKNIDLDRSDQDDLTAVTSSLGPEHATMVAQIKDLNAQKLARLQRLIKQSDEARGELRTSEEQRLQAEVSGEGERFRLREKIEQLSVEIEAEKNKQLDTLLGLEADLKKRQDRIQELLDRRTTKVTDLVSDGQLLEAKARYGFVIINRGLFDDIRVGQRFVVYNRRGGKNRIKGEIEVITVEPHMSTARVMAEVDGNDPLIPGDHIHNNIYNPDEVKIYVLAGDFDRYSHQELKRFITEAGGKVDPAITTRTHYLVAGRKNADKALEEASLNGVTILSENQLLEAIRRTERYQIRRGMKFALAGKFSVVPENVIREFIKDNSGIIDDKIGDGLHVLIAGDDAGAEISAARLVGAEIINQTQLLYLMGPYAQSGKK